ncbi:putative ABC transport system ATP-binding protein [Evansella caseinilytica]|uniref:Putative ABC transport system ATP-binding protein n=1 Tax=Evansella caseinilytica TaxID=1503961 RepID=A0A1H3SJD6_9BACI|nr:ABC transporter ATP-binding protein [Evansella caseinilytica]SDZ38163.1 putative ABC transport system ATP-binding protein [Evansella caseinilytica]
MSKEMLRLENVSKEFGDGDSTITILKNISLSINTGEFVAIVGPSGSGKSTLLSIVGALLTPSNGSVMIDGENITAYKSRRLTSVRSNKVGFIFQSANLIPYLTVKDQLMLISDITQNNKRESLNKAKKLLNDLGISHRMKNYPNKLSGGEKQRVAIARAFMNDPDIVLADEPTASLDSERGRKVVEMISYEVKSRNKAAIMVTHDERMLDLCDRTLYIEDGKMLERA